MSLRECIINGVKEGAITEAQGKEAEDLFDIYQPSYDMLFIAYTGTDKFKTHDDTARLQLVNSKSNAFLNKILNFV